MGKLVNIGKMAKLVRDRLKSTKVYDGRTMYQKIIYFLLPEEVKREIYIPYLYGPYSPDVQSILAFMENRPKAFSNAHTSKDYENRIDRLLNFLKHNNLLSAKTLSDVAKIDYLVYLSGVEDCNDIKKVSKKLGWKELSALSCVEIESLKKLVADLHRYLQGAEVVST